MNTVLSHIVQKRLSKQYEDTATESLAFILRSSESARNGFMKFLRGIAPGLPPSLHFRTQQTKGSARPDMCGFDGSNERVFIENKFWAVLTSNQPAHYLKLLAKRPQPTVLLMVVPAARQRTIWRDLRLKAKVSISSRDTVVGGVRSVAVGRGQILALTTWDTLLSAIKEELKIEHVWNNLNQLIDLCGAAGQAFVPMPSKQVKNKQTPIFILQLSSIVQQAVDEAHGKGVLSKKTKRKTNLLQGHSWERVGRYFRFHKASGVGAWFGTDFTLWKEHGTTPLWLVFSKKWGRAAEVQKLLESWIRKKNVSAVWLNNDSDFAIGIELATDEEETAVITSLVKRLEEIAKLLSKIGRKRN